MTLSSTTSVINGSFGRPGVARDQTPLKSHTYTDCQHARFYNNEPRKIGGALVVQQGNDEIIRGMIGLDTPIPVTFNPNINTINLYCGRASSLSFFSVDEKGNSGAVIDVTPATYGIDDRTTWMMDRHTVSTEITIGASGVVIAMSSPDLNNLSITENGSVFYGQNGSSDPLVQLENINLNGFVCCFPPYIFIGGQAGLLIWNDEDTYDFPDDNFLLASNTRLIKALPIRGSSVPAILVWSLNTLTRVVYDPTASAADEAPRFSKEIISRHINIISKFSVIEVAEISTYFWIGKNCFYQYTGVVQELPNAFNKKWFFDNLNRDQQEKCWTWHNAPYNEIWFFGPLFGSEECNHAVIYNYFLKCWYDTRLVRSCGIPMEYLSYPILADGELSNTFISHLGRSYSIWMHEYGVDLQVEGKKYAIQSFVRTAESFIGQTSSSQDFQTRNRRLEPDLTLIGNMKLQIYSRDYPGSDPIISDVHYLRDQTTGQINKVDINQMGRINSYYFESNEVGGFYQFGNMNLDILVDTSERPSG